MKALTLWEPWATFIRLGVKQVETRSWSTNYRGPLVIHAGSNKSALMDALTLWFKAGLSAPVPIPPEGGWPLGCVIAVADLLSVQRTEHVCNSLTPKEKAFGDYSDGRFAWTLGKVQVVEPIQWPGAQGLWPVPAALKKALLVRGVDLGQA